MVYAVNAAMAFQNASRRDNAHSYVVTRMTGLGTWGPIVVEDADSLSPRDAPAPTLVCEFRFLDSASRDQFYVDLSNQLQGVNGPVAGSWIAKHDCPHDESSPAPCVESDRRVF